MKYLPICLSLYFLFKRIASDREFKKPATKGEPAQIVRKYTRVNENQRNLVVKRDTIQRTLKPAMTYAPLYFKYLKC